jgi:hypothetical protein
MSLSLLAAELKKYFAILSTLSPPPPNTASIICYCWLMGRGEADGGRCSTDKESECVSLGCSPLMQSAVAIGSSHGPNNYKDTKP